MAPRFPLHLTLLLASVVATLVACAVAWPHRRTASGACLLLLLVAICEWQITGATGITSGTLAEKRWWAQVQYAGIVAVPSLWLHFVLRYLGDPRARSRAWIVGSAVIPLVVLLAAVTSAHHGLLWSRIELLPTSAGVRAVFHHGPVFWLASAFSYALLLIAAVLLLRALRAAPPPIVAQLRILLLGGTAPWIANLLYLAGVGTGAGIDLTPLAFGITGICAAIAVADLGVLHVSPSRMWRTRGMD